MKLHEQDYQEDVKTTLIMLRFCELPYGVNHL